MPLTIPDPPSGIDTVLRDSATFLEPVLGSATLYRLVEGESSFFVGPIHNLRVDEILEGVSLSDGRLTGWYFLMRDAHGAATAIEIGANADTGIVPNSVQVHQGPLIESMSQILSQSTKLAVEHVYRLCLMRIPALRFFTAWLREDSNHEDMFLPFVNTPPGVEAGRLYPERELAEILRPAAEAVGAQDPENDS